MSLLSIFLMIITILVFLMLMIYIYNNKNNYHNTLNPCLSIDGKNKFNFKKPCDGSAHNDDNDN